MNDRMVVGIDPVKSSIALHSEDTLGATVFLRTRSPSLLLSFQSPAGPPRNLRFSNQRARARSRRVLEHLHPIDRTRGSVPGAEFETRLETDPFPDIPVRQKPPVRLRNCLPVGARDWSRLQGTRIGNRAGTPEIHAGTTCVNRERLLANQRQVPTCPQMGSA